MRMRKKTNLDSRLARCAHMLIENPAGFQGQWIDKHPGKTSLLLELGCGKGRFTAETALQNPDCLVVAIEKVPDALIIAMERAHDMGLENLKFISGDALALPVIFAENEVDRLFINFCDPWPKPRDARRRLTYPGFLQVYESILKPGCILQFKTDNVPLFAYTERSLRSEGWTIHELTRDLHRNGAIEPMTDYEEKFHGAGININRLAAGKEICK